VAVLLIVLWVRLAGERALARYLRWSPKTGQVAKRESRP